MIENKKGETFNEKINRSIEAVHRILGMPTCARFYKKFLLKKQKVKITEDGLNIPINLSPLYYEYLEVQEDFIDFQPFA